MEWAKPDEGAKKNVSRGLGGGVMLSSVISMQTDPVSNTWDASAVSETLRSGVRCVAYQQYCVCRVFILYVTIDIFAWAASSSPSPSLQHYL